MVPQRAFSDKLSEFSIFLAWPAILDIYSHGRVNYRGYYTVARRYERYFRALVRKILFLPREIKFISSSRRVMFFLLDRQKT